MDNTYDGDERSSRQSAKEAARKRKIQVKVRLSQEEAQMLERIKQATSLSTSSLFRTWLRERKLPDRTSEKWINELRRQGGLLKHIAYEQCKDAATAHELIRIAQRVAAIAARDEEILYANADDNIQAR
jgi:hypothetical protein